METTAAAATSPLEKTTADLRAARFVVQKLGETFDSFQVHSFSILSLAEQWRNLQASFGEVNKSLENRVKEMEAKEREFGFTANKLQRFKEEVELKRKTIEFGEKSLNDRAAKLDTRQNEAKKWFELIDVKKRQVIEREKAVEAKKEELAEGLERVKKVDDDEIRVRKVEEEVNECRKAVELEKVRVGKVAEELESREKQVDERCKSVELRESRVDERFKEVALRESRVEERFMELEVKEGEMKAWEEVFDEKVTRLNEDVRVMEAREIQLVKDREALEFKEDDMDKLYSLVELRESEINERFEEVETKEKELKLREEDVKVQCEELKSKDKDIIERLNKLMVDENDFVERLNTLKAKEKDLRDDCKALKDKENEFNARVASLEAREEGVRKRICDLEVKEKGVKAQCVVLEVKEAALNDRWEILEVKRKEVDDCGKAMKLKEKEVEESRREVEMKEKKVEELRRGVELKRKEVDERGKVMKLKEKEMEESRREVEMKEKKVEELRRGVELKRKEVDERGKAMKLKEKEMEESRREVEVKEKKVEELHRGVELKEKGVNELLRITELKGKEVDGRNKAMKLKEKEVEELRRGVEMKEKEVEELRRRAELKEIGVDELLRIVESKEKEMNEGLKLKQTQIDERSKELEVKEKEINERVKEMGLKEKQISRRKKALDLREKQIEDSKKGLELKERQVDDCCVEPKEKQCDELVEAVESVDVQPKEVSQVAESKKEQPCEIPQTMELKEEQTNGPSQAPSELTEFGTQKLVVEQNKMKLELKGKQVVNGVTTQENTPTLKACQKGDAAHGSRTEQTDELWKKVVDLKENQVDDKIQKHEEGQKPSDNRDCKSVVKNDGGEGGPFRFRAMNGKTLQMHLNDRFNEHGSMSEEIAKLLRSMTNPWKIVLDAVDGFFAPHLCKDGVAYETRVVRSSCLLLLEHLMKMRPAGSKALKKEASTVAIKWRAKMKHHGETEDVVLGFLLLHGAFYLNTLVKKTELRRLCGMIDHHKLAPRLRQRLGVRSEGSEVARDEPIQSDSLQVDNGHNAVDPLPAKIPDIHVSCRRMDEKGVLLYLIEHIKEYDALQDIILDALRNASDPAKLVLNVCKSCVIDHDKNRNDMGNTVCTFLLKQLMKSCPSISPEVSKEAKEFADFLKAKLKGSGAVLYYRFLQFVASYKLQTSYNQDDLLSCFKVFYYGKDVYRPYDNAHLCFALGLAKKIPGLIRSLIDRNKLLSAVKIICVFKLERNFPPVPLLKSILEDVKKRVDEKRKKGTFKTRVDAETTELFALKGVVSCITNFKLESELPLDHFVARIKELENEKEQRVSAYCSRKRPASPRPSSTTPSQEKRPRLGPVQQNQHVPPVVLNPFPPGPPPMQQPSYGLPAYNTHFYAHAGSHGVGQHLAPGHFMPGAEMYPVGAPMHNHRVNDPARIAPYHGI